MTPLSISLMYWRNADSSFFIYKQNQCVAGMDIQHFADLLGNYNLSLFTDCSGGHVLAVIFFHNSSMYNKW